MTPKRPKYSLGIATTPGAAATIDLLGYGARWGGVALSRDEWDAVRRLYGDARSDNILSAAIDDRNILRLAADDGLRILAWVARHVPAGSDPLATVVQVFDDNGIDVRGDGEWATGEEGNEDE